MKKILATILALTMIVGMSLTAFAANYNTSPANGLVPDDTVEITVGAEYKKTETTHDDSAKFSVNVTWEAISFTFTEAANIETWDPATLTYKVTTTNSTGVWSGDEATITIQNRSNRPIAVDAGWEKAANGANVKITNNATMIERAEINSAKTGTVLVGAPENTDTIAAGVTTLGTLTLTITEYVPSVE